ncbi:glycosyltransferase family 4 protein [Echinicola vietnamensis]|uniref:Glycosyltransferase n=1 Tax=Echinicola vietnamensis (strain DSM 17526 / LMG 23754 / KMM 6221) TaxID=926556 RepID=L0G5L0_ECHVK|nr:glycosyltransferase family 4 protein [Echinicola vietnamensis]AGA80578.1 glycosyltransferase [Echinicola vietnamensis DSM 17526]
MILQICSYYPSNVIHGILFSEIDKVYEQHIHVPMLKSRYEDWNKKNFVCLQQGEIFYSPSWNPFDRINYRSRINKSLESISVDYNKLKLIHAHTWFVDGGVAYEIFKKFNIPYVITVRNSDINSIYKWRIDLRGVAYEILKSAKKIIVLSPSYKLKLLDLLPKNESDKIVHKIEVVPSGLKSKWLQNNDNLEKDTSRINFLSVGRIVPGKNFDKLIEAYNSVNIKNKGDLYIVGFENLSKFEIKLKSKYSLDPNVKLLDRINDFEELINIYKRCHVFVLPSKRESFGLVYIEALSQGCPIIYTKNEGVDGFFNKEDMIGISVEADSIYSIKSAMEEVANNFSSFSTNTVNVSKRFSIGKVAGRVVSIYNKSIKE